MDKANAIIKSLIEDTFDNFVQEEEYSDLARELDEEYIKACADLSREASDKLSLLTYQREKFGFFVGFQYAMRLAEVVR